MSSGFSGLLSSVASDIGVNLSVPWVQITSFFRRWGVFIELGLICLSEIYAK